MACPAGARVDRWCDRVSGLLLNLHGTSRASAARDPPARFFARRTAAEIDLGDREARPLTKKNTSQPDFPSFVDTPVFP